MKKAEALCRPLPYHLATVPREVNSQSPWSFSTHYKQLTHQPPTRVVRPRSTAYYAQARESAFLAYQLDPSSEQVSQFWRDLSGAR